MTNLCFETSMKIGQMSLKVLHFLLTPRQALGPSPVNQANDIIKVIKAADVKQIQIIPPHSRLFIVIEGNVDGSAVSVEQMHNSAVGKHLLKCLRKNSDAMCIHDVSDITIENGKATISFSSSHAYSDGPTSPHLFLLSLKLVYTWTSALAERDGLNGETNLGCEILFNPITTNRVSPFVELLDKIFRRLLSHHIIRSYPWIFGPHSRAIRKEQAYFPIIARSLCSIIGKSQDLPLKTQFLAKIKKMQRENALRDQLSCQYVDEIVQEENYLSPDRASTNINSDDPEEQLQSFAPTLEQFLTNLYAKGVKPWIKGLHGYSDSGGEDDSYISVFDPILENSLTDLQSCQDETPELDWASSPAESEDTDSIDEFGLIHDNDVYDENDLVPCVSEACEGFSMNMGSARATMEARSAGNFATAYRECLESTEGYKFQHTFSPRNGAGLMKGDNKTVADEIPDLNLPYADLVGNKVVSDNNGTVEEPDWLEMDIEGSTDGISNSSQFEFRSSQNMPGSLLSGVLAGQECAVHVNDLLEYDSDSEMEWDPIFSQLVDSDSPQD